MRKDWKENRSKNGDYRDDDEKRLKQLQTLLAASDPAAELGKCAVRIQQLEQTKTQVVGWRDGLSGAVEGNLTAARQALGAKEQAANAAAAIVAQPDMLPGVGTETWKELWRYAKQYSSDIAYPGIEFPNTSDEAKCLLCHQHLDSSAQKRFLAFEEYVSGVAQQELGAAQAELKNLVDKIPSVVTKDQFATALAAGGISEERSVTELEAVRLRAEERRKWLLQPTSEGSEPLPDKCERLLDEALSIEGRLKSDLEKQVDPQERVKLQAELRELLARKWLKTIVAKLETTFTNRRRAKDLRLVLPQFDTTNISTKKGQLTGELISDAFAKRVKEELEKLNAGCLRVRLQKQGTRYGHVPHRLELDGCTSKQDLSAVLSEGECKIIALATFLAHMRGDPHPVSFVFDDPVNSLDDEFEDTVVARLVELALERQVIVLTHRISLLVKLRDASPDGSLTSVAVSREPWGTGQPRRVPIGAHKARNALNAIKSRVQDAQKKQQSDGTEAVEHELKGLAGDIRICVEDLVERVLLDEVVLRFRRDVQTKNRIHGLAKISREDCCNVERWMTFYSQYEHSQPVAAAPATPDAGKLTGDIDEMVAWIDDLKSRRNPS